MFAGRRVLVGVTGSIAAYKVCEVVSTLVKAGAEVRVVLTGAAERFVSPLTFATIARGRAYTDADFWQAEHGLPLHISLGQWAEVLVIAPLTANTLAKLVHGLADDLLGNIVLASTAPILLAPAMNTQMWEQATVERNWQQMSTLKRYHASGPGTGLLACDTTGSGRMSEPATLTDHIGSLLWTRGERDLRGRTVLVSAGGTREFLDPVRFMGNPSTGRMGIDLAAACMHRGAIVHLVHGPMGLSVPEGVVAHPVVTASQMHTCLLEHFEAASLVLMAAAVADVRPTFQYSDKIPKQALKDALDLDAVPDIVADLAARRRPDQVLVGFAAQTGEDFVALARQKLLAKGLDAIVANRVDLSGQGFGGETNQAILLNRKGQTQAVPLVTKLELSHRILDFLEEFS